MAPINFEDKLKDKLENRSLQPSPDAWNSLADRLDNEDKKNSNTRFWWIGIAASIVGVILVTTQFYKSTPNTEVSPIVVETKPSIQSDKELITDPVTIDKIVSNSEEEDENVEGTYANEVVSVSINRTTETQKPVLKEKAILQIEEPQVILASVEESKPQMNDNIQVKVLSQEELKIIEVVDIIKQLQTNESSVSDKEIDSLLKQAQREILKTSIYDETTRTVDANALLQDVEVELEHSFRDKVFEALKSSYKSVKTAVAERRN
ncbi:hypothetical protein [Psychroserpens sp.]